MAINYRPLDRSKNEIRLLRVLPLQDSSVDPGNPLSFSSEMIRCELQYESLDRMHSATTARDTSSEWIINYLLQDVLRSRAEDGQTDVQVLGESLRRTMRLGMSADRTTNYTMDSERKKTLEGLHATSKQTMESWIPAELRVEDVTFRKWLNTWVWHAMSGNEHHSEVVTGYFALSYVWLDQATPGLGGDEKEMDMLSYAAGTSPRELLEADGHSVEFLDSVFGPKVDAAENMTTIILDGKPIRVGKSLNRALQVLRELPEVANGAPVWVDAVCINQADLEEKAVEVKRMGDIYRKAARVISWLGDEQDGSGDALEFISRLGDVPMNDQALGPLVLDLFQRFFHLDVAVSQAALLARTYWQRAWITQEVALGGENSIAICGARRFPWPTLLRYGRVLQSALRDPRVFLNRQLLLGPGPDCHTDSPTAGDLMEGISRLTVLQIAQMDARDPNRPVPASNKLWFKIPSTSRATDARDLVYGMMNLLPHALSSLIHVDYSPRTHFVDVMASFARAHITATNSLSWILHRPYAPFLDHADWPSWVPNLAQTFSIAHWEWAALHSGRHACPSPPDAQNISFTTTDTATGRRLLLLTVRGYHIDTILSATRTLNMHRADTCAALASYLVSTADQRPGAETDYQIAELRRMQINAKVLFQPDPVLPETPSLARVSASSHQYSDTGAGGAGGGRGGGGGLKSALGECLSVLGVRFPTSEAQPAKIFDIPWTVITADRDLEPIEPIALPALPAGLDPVIQEACKLFADLELWGTTFRGLFAADTAEGGGEANDDEAVEMPFLAGNNGLSLGRLFTTCSGHVGAGMCSLVPGDEVFLLQGCRMPVVLRRSEKIRGGWELMGGVVVPGVMGDEGVEGREGVEVVLC